MSVLSAQERRAQVQAEALAMGIDEAYISQLVDQFYTCVRKDPTIGPIFENTIGDNWDVHLATMKSFWASVALNAGHYSGKPVPKHHNLLGKKPEFRKEHFKIWLALFRETLEETAPTPAVVLYFMERAERIAKSLQLALFYSPVEGMKS